MILKWLFIISINSPLLDSLHTMPSKMTEVPGSHGPRQSGSVITPIVIVSVPMSLCPVDDVIVSTVDRSTFKQINNKLFNYIRVWPL